MWKTPVILIETVNSRAMVGSMGFGCDRKGCCY